MKRLIAEFEKQSFTQIIFPHKNTDWAPYLQEAQTTFVNIINAITKYQKCLVVCYDIDEVKKHFSPNKNIVFVPYVCDDTWARDCSVLSVDDEGTTELLDFTFTAWGGKFEASRDNLMSQNLAKYYSAPMKKCDFILEGGGVESNGAGLILTTSECMLNSNRNASYSSIEVNAKLQEYFGAKEILILNNGYLSGDDTDSHIDTLARFINNNTIMYVQCSDENDEHYKALYAMEQELKTLAQTYNLKLITLPMADALYYEEERLPATYANFLFVNGAVIVPTYGGVQDKEALKIFEATFPELDIVGVDCSVLVRQHGSLHCVTMNFPASVTLTL
ncbi:MAG: agmatine deiminase family protein [Campylobacterales bacterium]|nr:agmatine deiminase family protein [Campylobacterales bacterium]